MLTRQVAEPLSQVSLSFAVTGSIPRACACHANTLLLNYTPSLHIVKNILLLNILSSKLLNICNNFLSMVWTVSLRYLITIFKAAAYAPLASCLRFLLVFLFPFHRISLAFLRFPHKGLEDTWE